MSKKKKGQITNVLDSPKGKVLFVEDENGLVSVYHDYLFKKGYDFMSTANIKQAYDNTRFEQPDVVLLDIVIPKPEDTTAEQGWEYLEMVKSDPNTEDIPVIVFTNLDTTEARKKSKQMGAAAFIFKRDVTPSEVEKVIATVIENHTEEGE